MTYASVKAQAAKGMSMLGAARAFPVRIVRQVLRVPEALAELVEKIALDR